MMKNFTQSFTRLILTLLVCVGAMTFSFAQRTVTGQIKDDKGNAIPGASILIKGTSTGTTTDANGNFSLSVPNDNAVLVISSVGLTAQEIQVGANSNLNITMSDRDDFLGTLLVTATQKPVRRLEAITGVDVIGAKELARSTPINLVDAVRFTPGVFVHTGPGRTRNGVWVRGFPDLGSNGLIYTSLLFDGLRTFASPEVVPDAAFRMDMNIDKIEIVRGAVATLYGRGAAAGAINVISKTGGEKFGGGARLTYGTRGMLQVDANVNGPISEKLRYNLGGFYLKDDGLRDNPFPDKGYQFRGNLDYLMPNGGNIRFFAGAIDLNVQNQIDLPYKATELSKPAAGYTTRDVVVTKAAYDKHFNKEISLTYPDGTVEKFNIKDKMEKGNFSKGYHFGLNFNFNLGAGFSLVNKGRYQDMIVGTQFDFPLTTTYNTAQNRVLFVGNGLGDGGSHAKDFINEIRLQKTIEGKNSTHNLTAGYYVSSINVRAVAIGHFYNITTGNAAQRTDSIRGAVGFGPAPVFLNSLFRNGTYKESVSSFFAGDEMKFGDNLTINAGIRQDYIKLDLLEDRYTDAVQRNATRKPEHDGISGSVGFNFLVNEKSAFYGNYLRAYRAPDYSAYTTVQYAKYTKDASGNITGLTRLVASDPAIIKDEKGRTLYLNSYIDNNEIINSYEMGYRTAFGDLSVDGAVFLNNIKDRLVSSFIGATAVQVPGGDNRIMGTEISLYYAPQSLSGFYARTNVTLQSTEYVKLNQALNFTTRFDLSGNKVAGIPSTVWNLSVGYEKSNFGVNFNSNTLAGRPVDPFNTINYPTMTIADANAYYRLNLKNKSNVKLKASITNLFDNQGAMNVVSGSTDNFYKQAKDANFSGNFTHVRGVPQLPRRVYVSLEYLF
jgi:outer membrane receptor protein involved in Fe transport